MTTDVVDRLVRAGLEEVHLPSGMVIRGRLPTIDELYIRDLVPDELLEVVQQFITSGAPDEAALDAAEKKKWKRGVRLLVVAFVHELREADGTWRKVTLSIDDTFTMDPRDIDELEYIAWRVKTPAMVSAVWRAARGEITEEEAEAVFTADVVKTASGWATFLRIVEGAYRRSNGAAVRAATERAPGDNRATRRASRRRVTRHAPRNRNGAIGQGPAEAAARPALRD